MASYAVSRHVPSVITSVTLADAERVFTEGTLAERFFLMAGIGGHGPAQALLPGVETLLRLVILERVLIRQWVLVVIVVGLRRLRDRMRPRGLIGRGLVALAAISDRASIQLGDDLLGFLAEATYLEANLAQTINEMGQMCVTP
jgi:hypothetical protein